MIPLVSIKVKVGPKGQIVIPKVFRDAYGIKEGGEAIIIPTEDGLVIKKKKSVDEILETLKKHRERRKRIGAVAKIGELEDFDLEEEFDEDIP